MDGATSKISEENPIGNGLDAFRNGFASICDSMGFVCSPDAFDQLEQSRRRYIAFDILTTLARLRAAPLLHTASGDNLLLQDLVRIISIVNSDDFPLGRIKPLLKAVLDDASDDVAVWTQIHKVFSESTPPPSQTSPVAKRFIDIERDDKQERLIIDEVIRRPSRIAGRATTCWKAHREGDPLKTPLVIKDSWQYPDRDEEGLLVKEATEKGVVNVARYYHHETVHVGCDEDEMRTRVGEWLDTMTVVANTADSATGRQATPAMPNSVETPAVTAPGSIAGTKRRQSEAYLDDNVGDGVAATRRVKRACLDSAKSAYAIPSTTRVRRRVVLQDYGRPIYTASSPTALLAALESCIRGHESLRRQAGLLHRDISVNNVVIDEDGPPDRKGFLIDLDHAIKEQRIKGSGAEGKTGTRAFMAIGVLLGKQHSFMHDLESFFWVLFWVCAQFDGPGRARESELDEWDDLSDRNLAGSKILIIFESEYFCRVAESSFTPFYTPLIPLMDGLRSVVFPGGQPRKQPDEGLYSAMRQVLLEGLE